MEQSNLMNVYLGSPRIAQCFSGQAMLKAMLAFETALAEAQAESGIIPVAAASVITDIANNYPFDLDALAAETVSTSNPAIPLVSHLTQAVADADGSAAHFVHWGATSQDVMDSAIMLASREAYWVLDDYLRQLARALSALIREHRSSLLVARTLSQHAAPTTFGYKAAGWLNGLLSAAECLADLNQQLPLQFAGASGTQDAYGKTAVELAESVAAKLGLVAVMPWHTERSFIRRYGSAVAELAASGGKIATDCLLMMQTEVDELDEADVPGRGGSSALPHKRNPVAAIGASANARRAGGALANLFAAFDHTHERASGAWHAEQDALRELFSVSASVLERLQEALSGLTVKPQRMHDNAAITGGEIYSEAVVMALAPAIGRPAARTLVKAAIANSRDSHTPLVEVLGQDSEVMQHLDASGLKALFSATAERGSSGHWIDTVLARSERLINA